MTGEVSSEMLQWLLEGERRGSVHSVFSKAVNIQASGSFISLLSRETLLEPMSVRLSKPIAFPSLGIAPGGAVLISASNVTIGALRLKFELVQTWSEAQVFALGAMPERGRRACALLLDYLKNSAKPEGFGVLFRNEADSRIKSYYRDRICQLLRAKTDSETFAAMEGLIGLGPGLTPSGDDFLAGFIRTERLFHPKVPFAAMIGRIKNRTTDISAKSLELAAGGRCSDELNRLLFSLLDKRGNPEDALEPIRSIASYGSSSGTDLLCGVCLAIGKETAQPED